MIKTNYPNLFIVGTAKAGTSSLHSYLSQHPEIFMSSKKEPQFFGGNKDQYYKTIKSDQVKQSIYNDIGEYLQLFKSTENFKIRGESSVSTMFFENGISEISHSIKNFKIIVILRNPVERAYSNYSHHTLDGHENLSFEEAINFEDTRKKDNFMWGYQYLNIGLYYEQLKRIYSNVPRDKYKIFTFEEFKDKTRDVLKEICIFLEIDDNYNFNIEYKLNKSGILKPKSVKTHFFIKLFKPDSLIKKITLLLLSKKIRIIIRKIIKNIFIQNNLKRVVPMAYETRNKLKKFYYDDIKNTEKLIGKDLSHWYR